DMAAAALNYGLRLSNHSYGAGVGWFGRTWYAGTNFYDANFSRYDSQAYNFDSFGHLYPEYLTVWPTGNSRDQSGFSGQLHYHEGDEVNDHYCPHAGLGDPHGGYFTLTPESTAKNILAVGSIHDLPNGWQSAATVTNSSFSNW